ncbi:Hsp70 family protein [Rickettsiales bacterium]|nr:Hsp70 family protein [Rickettsiales bacterium]
MALLEIKEPGGSSDIRSEEKICIGIDFGTTNCVCSVKKGDKISLIPDEKGKFIIPTIISYSKGDFLFGNQVYETESYDESKFIFSIKRLFIEDPSRKIKFENIGINYSPIELSTLIFNYLKTCSEKFLKTKITNCVITVPAYFDDISRSAIKKSASNAGLDVLRLINEPTAAAYAYGLEKKTRGIFFVYDIGGGTFDISILKLTDGVFKVLSAGGDVSLGGDDFDIAFCEEILKSNNLTELNDLDNNEKIIAIKRCKEFKEKLSTEKDFEEKLTINALPKKIKINIDLLNKSISKLVSKTIKISKEVLLKADLQLSELDGIIFVGGSSRLDLINQKITEEFKLKIFSDIDPDIVVARGAALHAFGLVNGAQNLLLDITPLSLGIETAGGLMEKIVERNSTIPIIKEQEFTTYENGQTAIKIHILQGERETVEDNRSLGEFILDGIPSKPPGIARIKVRFTIDSNGILSVTASEDSTGALKELEVKPTYGLEIEDMKNMIKDSIVNGNLDIEKRLLKESKIEATIFLNEMKSLKKELNDLSTKDEYRKINIILKDLENELKNDDRNKIKELTKLLDLATQSFSEKRIKKSIKSALVGKNYDNLL